MAAALDLQLQRKHICMLSGPSGSGKSQFLKSLADLIVHEGEVWLEGQAMYATSPENWRRQVMYFAAETAWWQDTVKEHFDKLPVKADLQRLGLSTSILEVSPDSLSSGEKQRLALLRGLQYQPKVLLLDEITANLDPESEAWVEQLIHDYIEQASAAAIWISHDSSQAERMATMQLKFKLEKAHDSEVAVS